MNRPASIPVIPLLIGLQLTQLVPALVAHLMFVGLGAWAFLFALLNDGSNRIPTLSHPLTGEAK